MRTHLPRLLRCGIPAVSLVLLSPHAHAQQDERIGAVEVHLQADSASGTDYGFAILRPDGGDPRGALVWACGGTPEGLAVGVYLRPAPPTAPDVVWRFDQDAADSSSLARSRGMVTLLRAADVASFTRRARTASRLTLTVPGDPAREHAYSLKDVGPALDRLGCAVPAADAELAARRAGVGILESLAGITDEGGSTRVVRFGVAEPPKILNGAEFARQAARNYPPLLRDAFISGEVVLAIRVREDGSVDSTDVRVVSATHEGFIAAARRSTSSLRFSPARLNGRPIRTWINIPVRFGLSGGANTKP